MPGRKRSFGRSASCFYLAAKGPHESTFTSSAVSRILLVSGTYDLEPISRSFLQAEISLTADEIANWSPVSADLRNGIDAQALVGSAETSPFHQQAQALALRHAVGLTTLGRLDHMTVVRDMGILGTPAAANALQAMLK